MWVLLALAAASSSPSEEAKALGLRLARTSGIVTIAPMLVQKDLSEIAESNPTLSSIERKRLMQIGTEEGKAGIERIAAALGTAYARHLSVRDLKILVNQNESPEAVRRRTAEPTAIVEAMAALGSMDFKKATAARMCQETKKLCATH